MERLLEMISSYELMLSIKIMSFPSECQFNLVVLAVAVSPLMWSSFNYSPVLTQNPQKMESRGNDIKYLRSTHSISSPALSNGHGRVWPFNYEKRKEAFSVIGTSCVLSFKARTGLLILPCSLVALPVLWFSNQAIELLTSLCGVLLQAEHLSIALYIWAFGVQLYGSKLWEYFSSFYTEKNCILFGWI